MSWPTVTEKIFNLDKGKQKENENVRESNLEFTAYNPFLHIIIS